MADRPALGFPEFTRFLTRASPRGRPVLESLVSASSTTRAHIGTIRSREARCPLRGWTWRSTCAAGAENWPARFHPMRSSCAPGVVYPQNATRAQLAPSPRGESLDIVLGGGGAGGTAPAAAAGGGGNGVTAARGGPGGTRETASGGGGGEASGAAGGASGGASGVRAAKASPREADPERLRPADRRGLAERPDRPIRAVRCERRRSNGERRRLRRERGTATPDVSY